MKIGNLNFYKKKLLQQWNFHNHQGTKCSFLFQRFRHFTMSKSKILDEQTTISKTLPQPTLKNQQKYIYIPQGIAASDHDINYDYSYSDDVQEYFPSSKPYPKDTLCWVLKGKGTYRKTKRKRNNAQLFLRARVVSDTVTLKEKPEEKTEGEGEGEGEGEANTITKQTNDDEVNITSSVNIEDEDKRVLVRYSKGATYKVRKTNLIPVLEKGEIKERIVLVLPETHAYRKACIVHTCIDETFLEIGCDYGCTVDRVQKALLSDCYIKKENEDDDKINWNDTLIQNDKENLVVALGIDKSPESIAIANERYPNSLFSMEDALTNEGSAKIRSLCQKHLVTKHPSVVAIDINGNRELPAVLECIKQIMCPESSENIDDDKSVQTNDEKRKYDMDDWDLPRLIIVKSRTLHELLMDKKKKGLPLV